MSTLRTRTLAWLLFLAVAVDPAATAEPHPFRAVLDRSVPGLLEKHKVPGASVVLLHDGRIAERLTYGTAKAGTETPIDPDQRFIAGSIAKTVTAWGVLRLVDQGKISLDTPLFDRVTRWRPPRSRFPLKSVTIGGVLGHTSGLTGDGMNDWPPGKKLPPIEKEFDGMAGARPIRLTHAAGTRWQYSNGGYGLLQILIEEVTRRPFADWMRDEVLRPLGLETAEFTDRGGDLPNAPTPHHPVDRPGVTMRLGATASGGLLISPTELGRIALALTDGPDGPRGRGVLRPATVDRMLAKTPVAGVNWTLGYERRNLTPALVLVGHGGGRQGWVSGFYTDPRRGSGIVVMTNSTAGADVAFWVERAWSNWYRDSLLAAGEIKGK